MELNSSIEEGTIDFNKACRVGDIKTMKVVLKRHPERINEKDDSLGWTPVYRTVICGHNRATRYLLKNGADPNNPNNLGETPLHQAADNSQYTLAQLLLDYGADANNQQNDGDTPLHHAAFRGDTRMIQMLLQANANVNITNYIFGRTPLHYAADQGQQEPIKLMLEFGGDNSITDRQGKTPVDLTVDEDLKQLMLCGFAEFSSLVDENTDYMEFSKEQESRMLSPITEVASYIPSSPSEHYPFSGTPHAITPEVFGKPSINHLESMHKISETQDSSLNLEPEGEKSLTPIQHLIKYDTDPLYEWLERLNLQYLYERLSEGGFDDISSMIAQMRSPMPITEESLARAGVDRPGHRSRMLFRLEEESGLHRTKTKRRQPSRTGLFECCIAPSNATFGVKTTSVYEWLEAMKLEHLHNFFDSAGYDDFDYLILQMSTRYTITDHTLQNDIGITKPGYRQRILSKLQEDAFGPNKGNNDNDISIDATGKSTACEMCLIM